MSLHARIGKAIALMALMTLELAVEFEGGEVFMPAAQRPAVGGRYSSCPSSIGAHRIGNMLRGCGALSAAGIGGADDRTGGIDMVGAKIAISELRACAIRPKCFLVG